VPVPGARAASKRNQSVQRAIALLRATAGAGGGASVSVLARSAGLPRATALRLIQTLEEEGFLLRPGAGDRVVLGPALFALARGANAGMVLVDLARVRLDELAAGLRETVTLSIVASDRDLDVVHQIDGPHQMRPRDWVGQRFPLHASSSGKVLLASDNDILMALLRTPLPRVAPATITRPRELRRELAEVRRRGYATTVDELEEGLAGVSVGITDTAGSLVGVVNVSGLRQRLERAGLAPVADRVRAAATAIEAELWAGHSPA
jgi:IclR family transcriptional regulator, acetate operon repressor